MKRRRKTGAASAAAGPAAVAAPAANVAACVDGVVFDGRRTAARGRQHVVQRAGRQHGLPIDAVSAAVRPVAAGQLRRLAASGAGAERSHLADQGQPTVSAHLTDAHRRHAASRRPAAHHRLRVPRNDDDLPHQQSAAGPPTDATATAAAAAAAATAAATAAAATATATVPLPAALSDSSTLSPGAVAFAARSAPARGLPDAFTRVARPVELSVAALDVRLVRGHVESAQSSEHVLRGARLARQAHRRHLHLKEQPARRLCRVVPFPRLVTRR